MSDAVATLAAALSGGLASESEASMTEPTSTLTARLMVCCAHCGTRGEWTDMVDSVQGARVWFACCGLYALLEEIETWTEET